MANKPKVTIRTENDKVAKVGIIVTFGGAEYEVKPLSIMYSSEWRKKAMPLIIYFINLSKMGTDDPAVMEGAISELFTTKIDEIIESFFEYARELDREAISKVATDDEIFNAFMAIFEAYVAPFGQIPGTLTKAISQ